MDRHVVLAGFDLYCEWSGTPPVYRVWLDDQLFTERTWCWNDVYLENLLQINSPTAKYTLRVEKVGDSDAKFTVKRHRIERGPARWAKNNKLVIAPWEMAQQSTT